MYIRRKNITAGGGQGCPFGLFMFLIMIDKIGPPCSKENILEKCYLTKNTKKKWVDDFTLLGSLNLKENLIKRTDEGELIRPLSYHEITQHLLPKEKRFFSR